MSAHTHAAIKCFEENLRLIGPTNATASLQNTFDWNFNSGLNAMAKAIQTGSIVHLANADRCFKENQRFIGTQNATASRLNMLTWNLSSGLSSISQAVGGLLNENEELRQKITSLERELRRIKGNI